MTTYDVVDLGNLRVTTATPVVAGPRGAAGAAGGSDAAQAGWIEDPDSLTRAALSATIGAPAYNLKAAGLSDATTNITPLITSAIAAGAKRIVVPYRATPWPLTTRLDAANVWLDFEPGAQISFNMTSGRAMDLIRVRLTNASFTSPYAGPTNATEGDVTGPYNDLNGREVRLGDDCVVDGYYHENACHGINIDAGSNITIRNASFKNIRHRLGWGAALHVSGTSSFNVRGSGFKMIDCDRGVEVEIGARDIHLNDGYQLRTYPKPYTGQPGTFAIYTFTLGAHSHAGEPACVNITGRNWELEECQSAVQIILSNGTDPAPSPRHCLFDNIRILGTYDTGGGYDAISIQGNNNVVRNVYFMTGTGCNNRTRVRFWGQSGSGTVAGDSNRIENVRAEDGAFALPFVVVEDGAVGSIIDGVRVSTTGAIGSGWLLDIAARYAEIRAASLLSVIGTLGFVRFQASADYCKIRGLDYSVATAETFANVILIDGAEHVQVQGVQGANYATTPPVDLKVASPARFATIRGNNFDRTAAGNIVSIASGATRNLVTQNVVTSATPVFENLGIENTVKNNKRGNWEESAIGSNTIANASASVTFNHNVSGTPEVVTATPRGGELIWVSAVTSTQITVSRVGTTGALAFDWRADNNPST